MKRKLGPLELWQWILIGAAVGVGTVLYRRGHPAASAAQNALAAATPSDAQYNPIDPTTGLPISGGVSAGAVPSTDTPSSAPQQPTLQDTLDSFQSLEGLLAGLQEIGGGGGAAPTDTGPAVNTDQAAVQTQTGTKRASKKTKTRTIVKPSAAHGGALAVYHQTGDKPPVFVRLAKPRKTARKNPGHHTTNHGSGKKTASSSAPHNERQHHNVQPPSHQRHDPTTHPSAQHPAARRPVAAHHHTPAAHPPAKRRGRR